MPTNTTPEYKAAEAEFRRARTPEDRLAGLREMLRTVPKHKGTEHLQADIKARIKELTAELSGPRKGGARTGPATVIRPEGAGQVVLLGPPNSGKSALHARLTGSQAEVAPYPFSTQFPLPGMLPCDDIHIQLVDLPPVSRLHPVPWLANALGPAEGALLVVDLGDPGCVTDVAELCEILAERRVSLVAGWDGTDAGDEGIDPADDPFGQRLPVLAVATKVDTLDDPAAELAAFFELSGLDFPAVTVSATSGEGLAAIGSFLFDGLGVVRVYTKVPGQAPDRERPFTVRRGGTVADVGVLIHKDLLASFRFARLWRDGFEGGQVGLDHPVFDGDVVEFHAG